MDRDNIRRTTNAITVATSTFTSSVRLRNRELTTRKLHYVYSHIYEFIYILIYIGFTPLYHRVDIETRTGDQHMHVVETVE